MILPVLQLLQAISRLLYQILAVKGLILLWSPIAKQ